MKLTQLQLDHVIDRVRVLARLIKENNQEMKLGHIYQLLGKTLFASKWESVTAKGLRGDLEFTPDAITALADVTGISTVQLSPVIVGIMAITTTTDLLPLETKPTKEKKPRVLKPKETAMINAALINKQAYEDRQVPLDKPKKEINVIRKRKFTINKD